MYSGKGLLVVVSGPSGSGKDTVVHSLISKHPEIRISVSFTTRGMRPHEKEGVDYYFLTMEEFNRLLANGDILEYTEYSGNYYGTPRSEVDKRLEAGETVVLVIETNGAQNIKKLFPDAMTVFLMPPSIDILKERLYNRHTETQAQVANRLRIAEKELALAPRYDYCVVNDQVEKCADEIFELINKVKQR
ncbi:MAG: guanylate kinase [Oscillospiraceae bacterium]|nr:guanylate kinase [Oscillospiraceae bacterium]MBR2806229.1 guanylate kinase [Oscillospiraceae bacterium]